jgi:hypothetical protein
LQIHVCLAVSLSSPLFSGELTIEALLFLVCSKSGRPFLSVPCPDPEVVSGHAPCATRRPSLVRQVAAVAALSRMSACVCAAPTGIEGPAVEPTLGAAPPQASTRRPSAWPSLAGLPSVVHGQPQQSATSPRSAHVLKVGDEVITSLPLVSIIPAV